MIDYKRILAKDTSLTCAKKNGVVFEKGYSIDKEWLERNIEKVRHTFNSSTWEGTSNTINKR
ncbi:MAG TPA: hypothetical protein PKN53_09760 [Bacteroidales bacterium]|nr:hypothetical protein [Bacteroidales bacterium]